jgi:hypothetical protein
MTAFNAAADLPANLVTLEQLSAWSSLAMQATSGSVITQEIAGAAPELAISANPFQIVAVENDYHYRLVCRQSIRLLPDWYSRKIWLAAQELSVAPLPAVFRAV